MEGKLHWAFNFNVNEQSNFHDQKAEWKHKEPGRGEGSRHKRGIKCRFKFNIMDFR